MSKRRSTWVLLSLLVALTVSLVALFTHGMTGGSAAQAGAMAEQSAAHKQLWHCGMHPQVIQDHPGDCPICHMALTPLSAGASGAAAAPRKLLYWWDPMLGPSSISDHPGKSAMGMDMVPYTRAPASGADLTVDPAVVQNMGVQTASVTRGPLQDCLHSFCPCCAPLA